MLTKFDDLLSDAPIFSQKGMKQSEFDQGDENGKRKHQLAFGWRRSEPRDVRRRLAVSHAIQRRSPFGSERHFVREIVLETRTGPVVAAAPAHQAVTYQIIKNTVNVNVINFKLN